MAKQFLMVNVLGNYKWKTQIGFHVQSEHYLEQILFEKVFGVINSM